MSIALYIEIFLALSAFAANAIICRLVLGYDLLDPASFTSIRLGSGIITLSVFWLIWQKPISLSSTLNHFKGSYLAAFFLFIYAVCFSYAYISLDTATGALILFSAVQMTLLMAKVVKKERLFAFEALGLGIAFAGLVYLFLPNLRTPSLWGFILMAMSGIAWAAYTLYGRASKDPAQDTVLNFIKTAPFIGLLIVFEGIDFSASLKGILLAAFSGGITSGLAYILWYKVLPQLSITLTGVLQLLVPILASLGGIVFSGETLSTRLVLASALILGGLYMVIMHSHFSGLIQRLKKQKT